MRLLFKITILLAILLGISSAEEKKNRFHVLCYHNVTDTITDPSTPSITTDQLISHFKWLKQNGYNVITVDDILAAKEGRKDLPEKSVLLTFDDGYTSFYNRIFPLLKEYGYHAVYALVGKWQETPLDNNFTYGTTPKPRSMLLRWKQVKEMADSGFVEIASHGYDAHYGVVSNPQGNTRPFYNTLIYDPKSGKYEKEDEYIKRVESDIKRSSDTIFKYIGKRPRILVWPYGAYNQTVVDLAKKYGMYITASLDDGVNTPEDSSVLKRFLVGNNVGIADVAWSLKEPQNEFERSLFVDIDEIYSKDANETDRKLGILIEKVRKYGATDIYVKGFHDGDGDGFADMVYFPNTLLPVRGDLLGRVLWQLNSRAGYVNVHAWMPLSSFEVDGKALSITDKSDRKEIEDIFYSLAKHTFFHGLLFDLSGSGCDAREVAEYVQRINEKIKRFTMRHRTSLKLDGEVGLSAIEDGFDRKRERVDTIFLRVPKDISTVDVLLGVPKVKSEKISFLFDADRFDSHEAAFFMRKMKVAGIMNFGLENLKFLSAEPPSNELLKAFSMKVDPYEE